MDIQKLKDTIERNNLRPGITVADIATTDNGGVELITKLEDSSLAHFTMTAQEVHQVIKITEK